MVDFPSLPSTGAPAPQPPAPSVALPPKPRLNPLVMAIPVALVLIGAAFTAGYSLKPSAKTAGTKTAADDGTPSERLETLSDPVRMPEAYYLQVTASVDWRTTDATSSTALGYWQEFGDAGNRVSFLRFVPSYPDRNTLYSILDPINTLSLFNAKQWLSSASNGTTAAVKQKYFDYLKGIESQSNAEHAVCDAVFRGSACADLRVKPVAIKTTDGALHGIAYLYMQTQSVSYDPTVRVELAGTIDGESIYASGNFALYDSQYEELGGHGRKSKADDANYVTRVQRARKDYNEGRVSADTMALYKEVTDMVKSIKLTRRSS